MQKSNIEWTDFTANPLKYRTKDGAVVWACIHKSGGCINCYAEALAHRYRRGEAFTAPNMEGLTPFMDEKELRQMLTYKPAAGQRCFVGDMTDLFGEWVPFELLDRLFAVFAFRSDITWQVLTKRPERMLQYLIEIQDDDKDKHRWEAEAVEITNSPCAAGMVSDTDWPLPNVWLGVSCEDQKAADQRIPLLLKTPAAIRFVSYEPALGPVDFRNVKCVGAGSMDALSGRYHETDSCGDGLDWIIVGGESSYSARPFEVEWARETMRQCEQTKTPVFLKQLGSYVRGRSTGFLVDQFEMQDGSWRRLPIIVVPGMEKWCAETRRDAIGFRLYDVKGGDPRQWPTDLRIREFPKVEVPA